MAEFEVVRQIVVAAEPARIHGLIEDFHRWTEWSPWEDADPQLRRAYSGPGSGVGAKYAWEGNRKAGAGTMEIVSSTDREIGVRLEFDKPWKSVNQVGFALNPVPTGTEVVWRMTGRQKGLMGLLSKVVPMDKVVGKDFERGLARLRTAAQV